MLRTPRSSSCFTSLVCLLAASAWLAGCSPGDPLEEVRRLQQSGDFVGSIEPLRELLKQRPDDAEVHFLYGRALVMDSQPSLAEWSLDEAMKDPEWLVPAGMLLANGQLRAGNLDLAVETAGRILAVQPDNLDALLFRANAYAHSNRDEEKALEDVARIEALDPQNVEVMEPKIIALIDLERFDEAGEAIEEMGRRIDAIGADVAQQGWHCATAALFTHERGDVEAAEARWKDCTERFPTHANVIQNAVTYYDGRHEFERSLEVLRRAHEEAPESRDYRLNLTDRLRGMGRVEEAGELLEAAVQDPAPQLAPVLWVDLGQYYHALERYDEAADAAENALTAARALGDPNPMILLHYVDAQIAAGRLDRAAQVANEMSVEGHKEMVLARIAQEQGQFQEALVHFEAATQLWPENPYGRYYAARAAEQLGRFDEAIDSYRYAVRLGNAATDAKLRLARLLRGEGHTREALETIRHQALGEAQPQLDVEGELLSLELWAALGLEEPVRQQLARFQRAVPQQLGRAAAAAAEGYRQRSGAAAALRVLRGVQGEGLSLTDPEQVEALRALVRFSDEAGELEAAKPDVQAALGAQPDASVFHEVHGLWLERAGRTDEAERAYARATELDAKNARAWIGRGRLAAASDPDAALGYLEQAREADPEELDALREAARVLIAAGRPQPAEQKLEQLLALHSYDADAAARLAGLQLERSAVTDQTLELANRAVRFGGGAEALDLLSRLHEKRGETELAVQAADRAQALRERSAGS